MIAQIAWRSIRRHGRRSILIIFAVALSVAVMELVTGLMGGMRSDFFETMVATNGHIEVDHPGVATALDPLSLDVLIDNPDEIVAWFREQPEVATAEAILTFGALVVSERTSMPMVGHGVQRDTAFFTDVRRGTEQGTFPVNEHEILLSTVAADLLDVTVGDPVSVLVEDSSGAPYYLEFTIAGLFRSESPDFDERAFLVRHDSAAELLYLTNETRMVRVVLAEPAATDTIAAGAAARFGARARTWREMSGGLASLIEMFDVFMYAINILLVVVAASVITNAILMNVFEHVTEYGTMRAIGLTRRGELRLIVAEGLVYGVVGGVLGLLIGVPFVLWLSRVGIDLGAVMDSMGLGRELRPQPDPVQSAINALFGATTAVLGSLYAARVATRMTIIESIRGTA
jgi:putative ABC transport system permease protein